MSRDDPRARMLEGTRKSIATRRVERQSGLAFARRYREEQPFKALLDKLYPRMPFAGHRTCADWG